MTDPAAVVCRTKAHQPRGFSGAWNRAHDGSVRGGLHGLQDLPGPRHFGAPRELVRAHEHQGPEDTADVLHEAEEVVHLERARLQ